MATDLERFVDADGRADAVHDVRKKIDDAGVQYVYYQFPSVTGRVMGKGVPAQHWETIARKGFQLVYGATANLFTDRLGAYIGFGPEESELAAMADLDTFEVLPWDNRVARVFCDCYDTETGELLDADPRQNLKRVTAEFEEELGLLQGQVMHLEMGLDQMFAWRPLPELAGYRLGDGLYLCGASTHPGGGVFGASGRTVAGIVLGDRRRRWGGRARG